jgi:hypothetical protein
LVGKPESGKTTFIERYRTGKFIREYAHTEQIEERTIVITTSHGMVYCTMFDIPFQKKLVSAKLDALFVFHVRGDENDINEYIEQGLPNDIMRVDIQSFSDSSLTAGSDASLTANSKPNCVYLSAKNNNNIHEPFAYVIRNLISDEAEICNGQTSSQSNFRQAIEPMNVSFWSQLSNALSNLFGYITGIVADDMIRGDQ